MRLILLLTVPALALCACAPRPRADATPQPVQAPSEAPAGTYFLDPAHTSVNFRVSHMGLSHYTARFTRMDGTLRFDPAKPAAQQVTAAIDATSLQTNYPDPAHLDFDSQVEKEFLGADRFPTITFTSMRVEPTGARTARITGDLSLHGVTHPVVLEATFNGGYKPNGMDPLGARVGFSARGTFRRSDFGISYGLPAPGSAMGVGDEVDVTVESELTSRKAP